MSIIVLQILYVCTAIVTILTFVVKRPPNFLVNIELALIIVFEGCFFVFHTLVAFLFCIPLIVLASIFYVEDSKLKAMANWKIYLPLAIFVLAFVLETIETFAGRLF